MMRVHHISLSLEQLNLIPQSERRLLALVAHAANELSVLSKLFHFMAGASHDVVMLMQAENMQALVIGRLLTGKIYECWKLLTSAFFGTALSKDYERKFDAEASVSLSWLKKYFSHDNVIATVRNEHAFHYSLKQVDGGFDTLEERDSLDIYLAKSVTNTLYAFGDTIAGRAMLESIKPGAHQEGYEVLLQETLLAVNHMQTVIGAIMDICFQKHLGGNLYTLGAKMIEIEGAPDSPAVKIPYFIEIHDDEDA
jgi:hypothetical protein